MNHAGLYIHIPFCQAKCGYCSFNSIPASRGLADTYLQALQIQAKRYHRQPQIKAITFDTIFFGGGTPTLASPHQLNQLLHYLRTHFNLSPNLEISIEANPNSISLKDLTLLREGGFNRLSLGVQSFHDPILKRIGRTHSGKQASQAVHWAREAGFSNLNCDLIYGLPDQTAVQWHQDLRTILDLNPDHLSLYELSIESGTPFHAEAQTGTLSLPDDDMLADMEEMSRTILSSTYSQYEISNFSKKNHRCRHNLTYWQNGTYLGLGAGAVSCINGLRFSHDPSPQRFLHAMEQNHSTISQSEGLSPLSRFRETIIMGLRLVKGVNLVKLEQQTNLSHQQVYGSLIHDLMARGHLAMHPPYLYIPQPLLGVANQILHQLV